MQINWFTVIAQILNFFLLIWLLKRFLYKPILKAIDEREGKIASQIKDAEAKEKTAKKEQAEFSKKNETFDKEKKKLMDKAITETNEEREKLLEVARNDAAELSSKLEKSLKEMQENMNSDLVQKTQHEVFEIARKTLADLASVSLEEQSANIFIKRINELNKEEKKQFLDAFKSESSSVLVQSAFDLPKKQQTEITSAVNEILGSKTHFQFKTTPEIISGIELTSNGYKLAWSISEYLNSLQKSISETSNEDPKVEAKEESKEKSNEKPKAEAKVEAKPKAKAKT
ncbi:MAG: F0F1 ATP synthase subunit B [Paludibacter sp.]|nr:F0F1 ATP synthase subunit B [Paludibacter sp.]